MSTWAGRDITPIATNRQIVRTPNLNEANIFRQTFLWEVVDCHFTLPLCSSRVGFSLPCFCLGDGESLCQKGDSPMKHRSWSEVITKKVAALEKKKKSPMPPKPYEGRSDLRMLHRTVCLHSQQQNHHYQSGRQPTSPWQLQLRW